MATLGRDTNGVDSRSGWGDFMLTTGGFVAPQDGTITAIKAFLDGLGASSPFGGGAFQGAGYEGATADTLIVTGAEVTVPDQDTGHVFSSAATGPIVAGHTYWPGLMLASSGIGTRYTGIVAGCERYLALAGSGGYPNAPASLTGASLFGDQITVFFEYTPAGSPAGSGGGFLGLMAKEWREKSGILVPKLWTPTPQPLGRLT